MGIEKGKLKITQTKRGWAAIFVRENGKEFPLSSWKPIDGTYDNKECSIHLENNKLLEIRLKEGGRLIYPEPNASEHACDTPETALHGIRDSFELSKAQFSASTTEAMRGFRAIDNFHLKFYKAARLETENEKLKFQTFKADKGKMIFCLQADFGATDFKAIADRSLQAAKAIGFATSTGTLLNLETQSTWRWVTGLGNASVL